MVRVDPPGLRATSWPPIRGRAVSAAEPSERREVSRGGDGLHQLHLCSDYLGPYDEREHGSYPDNRRQ